MTIQFNCVHCGFRIEAPDENSGSAMPCPECGKDVRPPQKFSTEPAPAPREKSDSDEEPRSFYGEPEQTGSSVIIIKWAMALLLLGGGGYLAYSAITSKPSVPVARTRVSLDELVRDSGKMRDEALELWRKGELDQALVIYNNIMKQIEQLPATYKQALDAYRAERDALAEGKSLGQFWAQRTQALQSADDQATPEDQPGQQPEDENPEPQE